jgi:hypothetical protein
MSRDTHFDCSLYLLVHRGSSGLFFANVGYTHVEAKPHVMSCHVVYGRYPCIPRDALPGYKHSCTHFILQGIPRELDLCFIPQSQLIVSIPSVLKLRMCHLRSRLVPFLLMLRMIRLLCFGAHLDLLAWDLCAAWDLVICCGLVWYGSR